MEDPGVPVLTAFLVFCRVGGCILFAPGLSSARIPMQFRLFIAIGVSLALSPLLTGSNERYVASVSPGEMIRAIASELLTGSLIGLVGRFFIAALQFAGTTISNSVGLAGIPGVALDDMESGSPLSSLASIAATMLLLTMNLHIEMLRAVLDTYGVIPLGTGLSPDLLLNGLITAVSESSVLALRLASPFIVYGVIVNTAVGLANRFAPQVSIYYATTGVTMIGGIALFWLLFPDWMTAFVAAYRDWLLAGGFQP